jgi:DNA primase
MADEPWAARARGWLKAVVADEEHGFQDLQRVLQRMWVNALGEDADAIANSGPDAEGLARLRELRARIAGLKAALIGPAGQAA